MNSKWRYGWLLLIMMTAVCLRLYDIAESPPGLTHDEADHGITAWEIVNGARAVYFTIGYGREPLFDYSTAFFMALLGPTYLAGRLVSVFFGLILISVMYAWVRDAFDSTTALFTAAGLAVGFWPLMTSRQSLRSETLPTLFVLALYCFWRGTKGSDFRLLGIKIPPFLIAGIFLGLTFYTYIPARGLWIVFPGLLGYLVLVNRPRFQQVWRGTASMLILAAAVATPLFYYLFTHPDVEERIRELSAPLSSLAQGNVGPLLHNAVTSIGIFASRGDTFWRYNIPGRPLLQPVMGALFLLGLLLAIWRMVYVRDHRPKTGAFALVLLWLFVGFSPVLVTGPDLSVTQAIGMQPVLYLFPALGLMATGDLLSKIRIKLNWDMQPFTGTWLKRLAPLILFAGTAIITTRDYFVVWVNAPEVRVQYESTMVAAVRYLDEYGTGAAAISTITPDRFHSPAVAQMTQKEKSISLRWFDGRYSLLLPSDAVSHVVVPGFTPISSELIPFLESGRLIESIPLRPDDLDRPLDIYQFDWPVSSAGWQDQFDSELEEAQLPVGFGDAADLLGYDIQWPTSGSGKAANLTTLWQVKKPIEGALIFTHLLGAAETPVAQADRLDVPSHFWHPGDLFIQLHELELPEDVLQGEYLLSIGMCLQTSTVCERLPIQGNEQDDRLLKLTTLSVTQ